MLTQLKQQNEFMLQTLSSEMLNELKSDILPFWMDHATDFEKGGYYGRIGNDLAVDYSADKGGILHSRILWTFSASYRLFKDIRYLKSAEHAYRFFSKHIWDKQYGGVFWMVDNEGNVKNDRKQAYNMAFAIYGLSEYFKAAGNADALEMAKEIFFLLETHFKDNINGGYIEAKGRDYSSISDFRLSAKDKNDIKSMNTHLHVLEAYTNLLRVWDDEKLKESQKQLLTVILDHIVDPEHHRFKLFFNETWQCSTRTVSYGHDIEGSWLLCEAADVLGDEILIKRTNDTAVKMAYEVLEHAVDRTYGGIYNEEEYGNLDTDKLWWPQAEAVVGFINAYTLTSDSAFLQEACRTWSFIKNYIIDKEYGEWFWKCDRAGKAYLGEPKVEPWKCPYHNGRACMEVFTRASAH